MIVSHKKDPNFHLIFIIKENAYFLTNLFSVHTVGGRDLRLSWLYCVVLRGAVNQDITELL